MRRAGTLLALAGLIAVVLKGLGYLGLFDNEYFTLFVVPVVSIIIICRFFGVWPFSSD